MAVKQTPARYEGFIFGGVDSKDYGVYIQDVNAYDAPKRDVEMIEVPGRNGAYALDKGRWENTTLTYNAFIGQDGATDFITAITGFRNAIGALQGYQRLEDEFNPDEYRQAVLKDGVGVSNINPEAGTFDITFDCKPQRYLTSGETAISVDSGDTVTNPTTMDAAPLLTIEGYGTIDFAGNPIGISNYALGNIDIEANYHSPNKIFSSYDVELTDYYRLNLEFVNDGDIFTWNGGQYQAWFLTRDSEYVDHPPNDFTGSATAGTYTTPYVDSGITATEWSAQSYSVGATFSQINFTKGTSANVSDTATIAVTYTTEGGTYTTNYTIGMGISYNAPDNVIKLTLYIYNTAQDLVATYWDNGLYFIKTPTFNATSTYLPFDIVIDLELGEAYYIDGGAVMSANNYASIPANLPTLAPGENTITFDNTIDSLQIVPRWWQL